MGLLPELRELHFLLALCTGDYDPVDLGRNVPVELPVLCAGAVLGTGPLPAGLLNTLIDASLTVWRAALVALDGLKEQAEAVEATQVQFLGLGLVGDLSHLMNVVDLLLRHFEKCSDLFNVVCLELFDQWLLLLMRRRFGLRDISIDQDVFCESHE